MYPDTWLLSMQSTFTRAFFIRAIFVNYCWLRMGKRRKTLCCHVRKVSVSTLGNRIMQSEKSQCEWALFSLKTVSRNLCFIYSYLITIPRVSSFGFVVLKVRWYFSLSASVFSAATPVNRCCSCRTSISFRFRFCFPFRHRFAISDL